ncbi:MAG: hypothetical protein J6K55_10760 [Clostridia bacterium]|nr:hypothetical protein [Clostridia bacterium]
MTSITVRHSTASIVLSKSFANASSKFGSEAYNQLQQVRRDYPTYTIEIATPKKTNKEFFKGLTLEYMEVYIEKHDDENHSIMNAFLELRGDAKAHDGLEVKSAAYATIKTWFLAQYPAVAAFQTHRNEVIDELQKSREKALKAKRESEAKARRAALRAKIA